MRCKPLHDRAMRFQEKLQKLMKAGKFNASSLGRDADVSHTAVNNWLKGTDPSLAKAARVARVLGVTLDYLADDEQEYPPPPAELTGEEKMLLAYMRRHRIEPELAQAAMEDLVAKAKVEGPLAVQEQNTGIIGQQQADAAARRSPGKTKRDQEAPKG